MKHTKGKWDYCFSNDDFVIRAKEQGGNNAIADVYSPEESRNDDEAKANAKLIASAPELLEACISLLSGNDIEFISKDNLKKIENAIKKATE
jgi:hypothetical protein